MTRKRQEKNLVIVESPTKAKTIGKFLGKDFQVESSYGHVRDLPKSKLGVDVDDSFRPQYVIPLKSRKQVTLLKKAAKSASNVILATDEDREGEAIAWHLAEALKLGDQFDDSRLQRIVFHEITKSAIEKALQYPRKIDFHLVDAQQARRVLDRLVGYLLSPFLWKKVFRGLSAGRVQSVALRLVVERENEIKNFKPQEYWSLEGVFRTLDALTKEFSASLYKKNGVVLDKLEIKNANEAKDLEEDVNKAKFEVDNIERKSVKRNPPPPFTTSTLQQEANKRLRLPARQTMSLAQSLYENGLITYMRTDSLNLSQESVVAAREWLTKNFGSEYALKEPRFFKSRSRLAQEAHEAIRPTNPEVLPDDIEAAPREKKLYELIWRRFLASQMVEAIFDATVIDVKGVSKDSYIFRANGNILKFDGYLKVYQSKFTEKELPEIKNESKIELKSLSSEQHFTEPPPRYNEASLVKVLEENGIGRPSTYAPTISVIQSRNYVEKNEQRRFQPTETGVTVNNILTENFPEIVDVGFTAEMEEKLDKIAEGDAEWQDTIKTFYGPFKEHLDLKYKEVEKIAPQEPEKTDEVCEKCGKPMVIKIGRFGKFLACSGFPDCKNTKKLITDKESFGQCPKCNDGVVIRKRTKTRRFFFGCSRYPDCDYASWTKPVSDESKTQEELKTEEAASN